MIEKIIFADWDDPDILSLEKIDSFTWLKLGLNYSKYEFFLDKNHWSLRFEDHEITSETLDNCKVMFRRWRSSPPRPIIISDFRKNRDEMAYIERQWEATILSALFGTWKKNQATWSRCPTLLYNKIDIYESLKDTVPIPDYWITQTIKSINYDDNYEFAFKSIHQDQSVGEGQRVSTIRVKNSDDNGLQPCPSILQTMISVREEWRVGFFFGKSAMVSVEAETDRPVDLRYATSVITKEMYSKKIEYEAMLISKKLGLNAFTADVLFDENGQHWWCDINPDGLFLVLDDDDLRPFLKLINNF